MELLVLLLSLILRVHIKLLYKIRTYRAGWLAGHVQSPANIISCRNIMNILYYTHWGIMASGISLVCHAPYAMAFQIIHVTWKSLATKLLLSGIACCLPPMSCRFLYFWQRMGSTQGIFKEEHMKEFEVASVWGMLSLTYNPFPGNNHFQ